MKREFIYTAKFSREWNNLNLTDEDLRQLEIFLLENPKAGKVMRDTGGLRKIRWTLPNKGKSSGIRILYIDFIITNKICMIDLFPKDEKENLSQAERNAIKLLVKVIGREFGNNE